MRLNGIRQISSSVDLGWLPVLRRQRAEPLRGEHGPGEKSRLKKTSGPAAREDKRPVLSYLKATKLTPLLRSPRARPIAREMVCN